MNDRYIPHGPLFTGNTCHNQLHKISHLHKQNPQLNPLDPMPRHYKGDITMTNGNPAPTSSRPVSAAFSGCSR